jgi:uncharacterized protein (TIGR02996 family)
MRTFTFSGGKSSRFWNIELKRKSFTVSFGRIGTKGQSRKKTFPSAAKARQAYDKLIQEKLARGYTETRPQAAPAPAARGVREALEEALAANPDDLAAHAAYADYLQEQEDPRGEFIQVQLALEDESKSAAERRKLQKREKELLKKHEREWLGDLAEYLVEEDIDEWRRRHDKINRWRWARGWLDDVYLWMLDVPTARALARAPAARLLRRLHIDQDHYGEAYDPEPEDEIPEDSECPCLYPLGRAPFLPQLRVFQLGETVDFERGSYNCRTSDEGITGLVGRMTRLEELYLLSHGSDTAGLFALPNLINLRTLLVYHGHDYPLEVLAANNSLRNLTTLRLHPRHSFPGRDPYLTREQVQALLRSRNLPSLTHLYLHGSDLGDAGCRDIVRSGILKRLKVLDLSFGCIQDEGARVLAECPDVKRLELLSLEYNELTDAGRALLESLGDIAVRCASQYVVGSDEYLWSGDME